MSVFIVSQPEPASISILGSPTRTTTLQPFHTTTMINNNTRQSRTRNNKAGNRQPSLHPMNNNNNNNNSRRRLKPLGRPPSQWKEALKRGCLDRARKKRQQIINAARHSNGPPPGMITAAAASPSQQQQQQQPSPLSINSVSSPMMRRRQRTPLELDSPALETARMLVEEELRANNEMSNYNLSDEELFQLMRDVDEELYREEQLLFDEINEMERRQHDEMNQMEEQIADYEMWQEMDDGCHDDTTAAQQQQLTTMTLLCPVCRHGILQQQQQSCIVSCSNANSGNNPCDFSHFNVSTSSSSGGNNDGLSVVHDILRRVYEEHSLVCAGCLLFRVVRQQQQVGGVVADGVVMGSSSLLCAGCETCRCDVVVLTSNS